MFARAFERLGFPFPHPVQTSLLLPDLAGMRPEPERRPGSVLQCESADGDRYLLVIASPDGKSQDQQGRWANYLAFLGATYLTPALLVVVCPDEDTARWAEAPFHLGLPDWHAMTVRPLALGPHNVPVITDPAAAAADLPLAVFGAIAHSRSPRISVLLRALASALRTVDETTAAVFTDMTAAGLGNSPAARIWQDVVAVDL